MRRLIRSITRRSSARSTRSPPPYRTRNWPSSSTWHLRCSRGSSAMKRRATAAPKRKCRILSPIFSWRSAIACPSISICSITSATVIPDISMSSSRPTWVTWWNSPIGCHAESCAQSSSFTCRCRATAPTMLILRHCSACSYGRKRNCALASSTTPTALRAPGGGWRPPSAISPSLMPHVSRSPPNAASDGAIRPRFPNCCAFMLRWLTRLSDACHKKLKGNTLMSTIKLAIGIGIVGVVALALAGGLCAAQADPIKIRGSYVVPVANWASLLAEKKDLTKHWGTSYDFEAVRYQGTPPMITAMAVNELEIGDLAYSTLGLAVQNAGLDDLQVIADEFQDGAPGYYSVDFFVRKDSDINKMEDHKGKVIATNATGSGVDIAMKATLHKHGLDDKRDYTTIEGPFPAMAAMLAEKKVDLIPGVLPFSLNPTLRQNSNVLFTQKEGIGRTQMIIWTARKSFIDKNRAAMVDFMEDVLRIERWYLDPKNHDEVAAIASKMLKVPPERLGWLFTKQDYYRDPDGKPDMNALKSNVDITRELGFFSGTIDLSKHTDLSLVEEAAKRLK